MNKANPNHFYDLDQIRQIPILEICKFFGIDYKEKSGKYWCKVRPEITESVILHVDRNMFHDFGTNQTSDNIGLVSAFFDVDRGKAIRMIGEGFHLTPANPREGMKTGDLTIWEYEAIGLNGYQAAKNFDFNHDRQSESRVQELSLRYAIPMNVVKSTNPAIYERILKQRALPYVRDLRADYYMELFSHYNLCREIGSLGAFDKAADNGDFADMIKQLQTAERVLERACRGTSIKAWSVGEYDPKEDLKKVLSGEVRIPLGNSSKREMESFAKQDGTSVKYQSADLGKFMSQFCALEDFRHSAFLKEGNVIVAYLASDYGKLKPILNEMRLTAKDNLNQQIKDAENKQGRESGDSISDKETPAKDITNREER